MVNVNAVNTIVHGYGSTDYEMEWWKKNGVVAFKFRGGSADYPIPADTILCENMPKPMHGIDIRLNVFRNTANNGTYVKITADGTFSITSAVPASASLANFTGMYMCAE